MHSTFNIELGTLLFLFLHKLGINYLGIKICTVKNNNLLIYKIAATIVISLLLSVCAPSIGRNLEFVFVQKFQYYSVGSTEYKLQPVLARTFAWKSLFFFQTHCTVESRGK